MASNGSRKGPQNDPGSFSVASSMTLGIENGGKITRNRCERGSGSENGDFLGRNAEVQQTLCSASPNGSPHDPKLTKFGRGETKMKQKLQKHAHENASEKKDEKKSASQKIVGTLTKKKSGSPEVFGSFWKPDVSATTATAMRGF